MARQPAFVSLNWRWTPERIMAAERKQMTRMVGEHRSAIARLSRDLHVPPHQVGAVYFDELHSLAATARIERYLGLIAEKHTRAVLQATKPLPHMEI
jgi:hypothetical protein